MFKRILIIDDDEDMLEMLRIVFQGSEYDVITSSKGMSVDEIATLNPSLVLLDVQINGYVVTGNELCRQIKQAGAYTSTPVFLMSAEENLSELAAGCNADGFFPKPFQLNNLVTAVRNSLP